MRMCFSTPTLTGLPRGLFPSPVPQALQSGSPACADVAEGFIPKALSCFDFSAKSSHFPQSFRALLCRISLRRFCFDRRDPQLCFCKIARVDIYPDVLSLEPFCDRARRAAAQVRVSYRVVFFTPCNVQLHVSCSFEEKGSSPLNREASKRAKSLHRKENFLKNFLFAPFSEKEPPFSHQNEPQSRSD